MQQFQNQIDLIKQDLNQDLLSASSSRDIEQVKVKFLGKKGPIQSLMQELKGVSPDDRPLYGKMINDLKELASNQCEKTLLSFSEKEEILKLKQETIDTSLPGRRKFLGKKHIILKTLELVVDILKEMGFSIQTSPDIETDYYNFEVLNFPPDHPARDMQDTFYVDHNTLLRTQMTDIQGHIMELHTPPLRIMAPGKCYRNEAVTARSHVFFHQVDIFYIDKNVTFADLLATKKEFLSKMFPKGTKWRFRPSYFPFVEPGLECDISCVVCEGKGCPICKHTGWLEISGAGMIHPNVLKNCEIDPEVYSGFAWGMGLDRLVMLMHSIKDIRIFTENDLRFLSQF
jgi:phenylalanyl-tRNA synthetase alpha chain